MMVQSAQGEALTQNKQRRAEQSRGADLQGYLGQLGVWGAIEGGYSVHICLLTSQKSQGASHAESHAPHLQGINEFD